MTSDFKRLSDLDNEEDGKPMKPSSISFNALTGSVESNFIHSNDAKHNKLSSVKLISFGLILLFVMCTWIVSITYTLRIESDVKYLKNQFSKHEDDQKQSVVQSSQKSPHLDGVIDDQKQSSVDRHKQKNDNIDDKVDITKDKDVKKGVTHFCSNLAQCEFTKKLDHFYHCYKFVTEREKWRDARDKCKTYHSGGFMAEIIYNATLHYLNGIINSRQPTDAWWLGASDLAKEGVWIWEHSKKNFDNTITNWAEGDPNNAGRDGEHCVRTSTEHNGKWYDDNVYRTFFYICEYYSDDMCDEGYRCDDC